jgi:hypothetical protein
VTLVASVEPTYALKDLNSPLEVSMIGRASCGLRGLAVFLTAVVFAFPWQRRVWAKLPLPSPQASDCPLPGNAVPADHSHLSEHNIEWVQQHPWHVQAELLLGGGD